MAELESPDLKIIQIQQEVHRLLDSGYCLTSADIKGICHDLGSPKLTQRIVYRLRTDSFERNFGINPTPIWYRGIYIYYNRALDPKDTDLEEVKRSTQQRRRNSTLRGWGSIG